MKMNNVRSLLWIAIFVSLTALGGFIRIPAIPVPITLQTLFVYLSGDLLGSRRGSFSQVMFIILGLMGVPVFTMGGGPGYVLQPTFGYILGFPLAAGLIGLIRTHIRNKAGWAGWMISNFAGMLVILTTGVLYLAFAFRFIVHQPVSWGKLLIGGVFIFLPGEIIKISLAAILARRVFPFFQGDILL